MRTKSLALLLGSVSLALALPACRGATENQVEAAAEKESGINLAAMDKSVKPGDDFFLYANGTWFKDSEIPADRSSIGAFFITQQELEKRKDSLIAEIAKSNAAAGSNEAKLKDYRTAFLDQAAIDQRSLPSLKADIERFMTIADKKALASAIGTTIRADIDPLNATDLHSENLFGIFVTQSMSEPGRNVPYLLQGGIGLPERDYYLSSDAEMAKIRAAYRPFIVKMLAAAGLGDAEARAKRVYDLEAKIAAAHATIVEDRGQQQGEQSLVAGGLCEKGAWDGLERFLPGRPTIDRSDDGRLASRTDAQTQRAGRVRAARGVEGLAGLPPDHPVRTRPPDPDAQG